MDPPRKKADRPITAAEVKSWFGNTKQQKLKPDIYGKIAACLNRLRWPSDPLPEDGFRPTTSKSGLWDLKAAAKTANTLLNYMPAMLSHWHEPKWSPEHRAAYEAVSALNEALTAAMPYVERPLGGPNKASTGKKVPKDWHMRSRGGPNQQDPRGVGHQWLAGPSRLTPGEAHDNRLRSVLLNALLPQTMLLADRGYDANWIRELARQQGAWANIPPKRNRKDPVCFSPLSVSCPQLDRTVL